MSLSVVMHEKSTPAQVAAVRAVVHEFDSGAEVTATYSKAIAPVSIFLIFLAAPFAAGFAGKAGSDAWDSLRELVQRVRFAADEDAQVVLEDSDGGPGHSWSDRSCGSPPATSAGPPRRRW